MNCSSFCLEQDIRSELETCRHPQGYVRSCKKAQDPKVSKEKGGKGREDVNGTDLSFGSHEGIISSVGFEPHKVVSDGSVRQDPVSHDVPGLRSEVRNPQRLRSSEGHVPGNDLTRWRATGIL